LPAVLDEARMLALEHRATLVCIDGISTLKSAAPSPLDFRRFIFDLNAHLRSLGATTIMLGPWVEWEASEPELAVAEGIMTTGLVTGDRRAERYLEVMKLRGSGYLTGRHSMVIGDDGITLFPRLETTLVAEGIAQPPAVWTRVGTGSDGLDQMLRGGLPSGSVTLVGGVAGAGKTVMGLSFLADGLVHGERGVYVGLDEAPSRLLTKAESLGLHLRQGAEDGTLSIHWVPSLELIPDRVVWQILDLVDQLEAKRLVIDGLDGILSGMAGSPRAKSLVTALMTALRARGVTTIATHDLPRATGLAADESYERLGAAMDNVVTLQYVELRSELHRLISILKVRESDFDPSIREFTISEGGLRVADTFGSAEAVLTGIGHWRGRRAQ
ncbi:MAG TPA: ATPase domain-containing protein, partial [Chloroflexota bacterium]|nr:ATPase domain-containing protein [Chloroflexota bacterium]